MIDVEEEVAHLTTLHDELIRRHGGAEGGPKPHCMESALGSAQQGAGYFEDEVGDSVLTLPAFVLVYIARNQCYVDGNKRVAWAAFTRLLARYDLSVDATDDDAEAFVLHLAANRTGEPQDHVRGVIEWAAARLVPLDLAGAAQATAAADQSEPAPDSSSLPERYAADLADAAS